MDCCEADPGKVSRSLVVLAGPRVIVLRVCDCAGAVELLPGHPRARSHARIVSYALYGCGYEW